MPLDRLWRHQSLIKLAVILFAALALLLPLAIRPVQAAGSARVYLNPSNTNISPGQNFNLDLRLDSGSELMTAVEVYGNYNASLLRLNSISYIGTPYNLEVENSYGNGNFSIVRVAFNDASGDVFLARLSFTALSAGSATVSISENSKLSDPEGVLFNLSRSGTNVNITEPPTTDPGDTTPPPSNPSPTPSPSPSPSPSSPSPNPSQPSGSNTPPSSTASGGPGGYSVSVKPLYTGYTTASFLVSTSTSTTATLSWGDSPENLEYSSSSANNKDHIIIIDNRLAKPATEYFYRVSTASASGATATTEVGKFTTLGLVANIQVNDVDGKGVKSTIETPDGRKFETDANGFVAVDGLSDGKTTLSVRAGWRTTDQEINLEKSNIKGATATRDGKTIIEQQAIAQNVVIELDYSPFVFSFSSFGTILAYLVGAVALIILAIRLFVTVKYRRQEANMIQAQPPTVVMPQQPPPPSDNDYFNR